MPENQTGLLVIGGLLLVSMMSRKAPIVDDSSIFPPPIGVSVLEVGQTGRFFHGAHISDNDTKRPFATDIGERWTYEWTITHLGPAGQFAAALIVGPENSLDNDEKTLALLRSQPGHAHFTTFRVDENLTKHRFTIRPSFVLGTVNFMSVDNVLEPMGTKLDARFVVGPRKFASETSATWYTQKFDSNKESDLFVRTARVPSLTFSVGDKGKFFHGLTPPLGRRLAGTGPVSQFPLGRNPFNWVR